MRHGNTFPEIIDNIKSALQFTASCGCSGFSCSEKSILIMNKWNAPTGRETLTDIRKDIGDCKRCKLGKTRKNIVFGQGDEKARLMFVGEGPGYEEDKSGKPFVGAAGELLTKIIAAIKLDRNQVYICNIVKCRPPGNRNPEPDEIQACFNFLKRQIAAVNPEFICALGAIAVKVLLDTDEPISKLKGKFYNLGKSRLIPTYHPAFLLRNPAKKRDVWEDMKALMQQMGINL